MRKITAIAATNGHACAFIVICGLGRVTALTLTEKGWCME
jgi:hypothetical protein